MPKESKTFKAVIVAGDGSQRIMEFSSDEEMNAYVARLNEQRLEDLGLIEHLNYPCVNFE